MLTKLLQKQQIEVMKVAIFRTKLFQNLKLQITEIDTGLLQREWQQKWLHLSVISSHSAHQINHN